MVDSTDSLRKLDDDLRGILSNDPEVEILGYPEDMPLIDDGSND